MAKSKKIRGLTRYMIMIDDAAFFLPKQRNQYNFLEICKEECSAFHWRRSKRGLCADGRSRDGKVLLDTTAYGVDVFVFDEYRWTYLVSGYRKGRVRGLRKCLRLARDLANQIVEMEEGRSCHNNV